MKHFLKLACGTFLYAMYVVIVLACNILPMSFPEKKIAGDNN